MKTHHLLFATLLFATPALAAPELAPSAPLPAFGGAAGTTRDYAATTKGDYAKENFRAETTVTVKSGHQGHGIAFFGLGRGAANPAAFNEPITTPSLIFRLCPNDFGGGAVNAALNGEAIGDAVTLGDGTHHLRFSWDAKRKQAWLEIHPHWKTGDTFTPKLTLAVSAEGVDFGRDGHLFVGGAGGASFSDFKVGALSSEDLAKLPLADTFPKDATARTWLPVANTSALPEGDPATAQADDFLKNLKADLRPVACWYKGPSLEAARALPGGKLELPNSKWESAVACAKVAGESQARDITLTLTLKEGSSPAAGLAAAFDFNDWSTENYVLLPASVYNGNRNRIVNRGYAQGLDDADYYRKDLPLSHGDMPHLAKEAGQPSKLEVNTSNVTTPEIVIFDKKAKRGFILLAEQAGRGANGDFLRKANGEILDNAFAVEESPDRTRATVVVGAPGVREKKPAFIGFTGSPDRGLAMKAGDSVTLKLRAYDFPADGIPAVLDKFMSVRKALTGPNHPRLLLPESEHLKRMVGFTDGRFFSGKGDAKFYMAENGDWIPFGWVGGWINTYQMLAMGDEARLERVTQTFDFGLKGQAASGYYHYAIRQDGNVTFREPKPDMNISRCEGDILYWMVKQFDLLKAQGRGQTIKPAWEDSMRKLADAMVKTWKRDGQWGRMVNVKTGAVSEYNSSGGVMCIGGLALAGQYFKEPRYLEAARQAARYYYERDFVKQGQTTGACADILQNADSETAFGFLAALTALYEATGEQEWLDKAQNAGNLAATWIVSYDYELPKFTALGSLGTKFAGTFWASTQNKHGAPGICTSSGDSLAKIFRATGDVRYAELLRDIRHAHADAIFNGGGTERLTYCDADSRGDNPGGTNGWVATNGALTDIEVPGIYLRTDMDRFYVYDSVEAKVLERGPAGVKLEIRNPTKFDAKVSIFAENAEQAQKPQGDVAFLKWPKVEVKAGETKTITVTSNGLNTVVIMAPQMAPKPIAVP